jgi:hypothetical protein
VIRVLGQSRLGLGTSQFVDVEAKTDVYSRKGLRVVMMGADDGTVTMVGKDAVNQDCGAPSALPTLPHSSSQQRGEGSKNRQTGSIQLAACLARPVGFTNPCIVMQNRRISWDDHCLALTCPAPPPTLPPSSVSQSPVPTLTSHPADCVHCMAWCLEYDSARRCS